MRPSPVPTPGAMSRRPIPPKSRSLCTSASSPLRARTNCLRRTVHGNSAPPCAKRSRANAGRTASALIWPLPGDDSSLIVLFEATACSSEWDREEKPCIGLLDPCSPMRTIRALPRLNMCRTRNTSSADGSSAARNPPVSPAKPDGQGQNLPDGSAEHEPAQS